MMTKKVAVVTGSAGGLGKGIAERLLKDGFSVMIHDINEEALTKTESELKSLGEVAKFVGDVSKKEDQEALVAATVEKFGQLNVFVNNAGIEAVTPFLKIDEKELERTFKINVFGTVYGTQALQNNLSNRVLLVRSSMLVRSQVMKYMKY